ncbi:hypothetical protein TH61_00505 [Rufibacter sp. DG15C]|uniref:tetratricopeptide repeat protein n=1 Tax=Rufibacter sp. DG15C TaxID=1379909 RepID=UPI00078E5499|nr:tetratricopeptide repeat protein [Rufibacter sp. DG15C]AMM49960.1 hypothetical protein TH61_00505 [Rufibacter sp. DG15C]
MSDFNVMRASLLAKGGEENIANEKYKEAVENILGYFQLRNELGLNEISYLDQPCYFNLAAGYFHLGNHAQALSYLDRFVKNDNKNIQALKLRMQVNMELDLLGDAIRDIDMTLLLDPNDEELLMNKGICCIRNGNAANAKDAFIKAKSLGNKDAQFYIDKYC